MLFCTRSKKVVHLIVIKEIYWISVRGISEVIGPFLLIDIENEFNISSS